MSNGPYFAEGTPAMVELETMVDKVGLSNVLYALSHIAGAKAEHLQVNWQDKAGARAWMNDARKLDAFAAKI